MFAAVGDIKQEPGSPPSAGEEGGWGEVGATGGGGKGDCLYDIVSSQTRFKHQQDNRNQVRYVETGDRTFGRKDLLLSLDRARIESQECTGQVKTETFQSGENERSK